MFLLNNMPFSYMRDIMDNFQAGDTALTTRPPPELISCQYNQLSGCKQNWGRFFKEIKAKNVRTKQQRME
jgi:hypothetical protein